MSLGRHRGMGFYSGILMVWLLAQSACQGTFENKSLADGGSGEEVAT